MVGIVRLNLIIMAAQAQIKILGAMISTYRHFRQKLKRQPRNCTCSSLGCKYKHLDRSFAVHHKPFAPERTFTRFLELPPELRERVYEYCCDNDRAILEAHFVATAPAAELAIACASRQLRKEALPVFYSYYRFPITLNPAGWINAGHGSPSQEWLASRWYHRLDPARLAMVRKLDLYYSFGRFEVDLDKRSNTYKVKQAALGFHRMLDVTAEIEAVRLLAFVKSILDRLVNEHGLVRLTAHAIDRFNLEDASLYCRRSVRY